MAITLDLAADLATHRITGFAMHGGERIDVPLISHIRDNLYTGGCRQAVQLPDEFAHVISLYPWEQYQLGARTKRVEYALYDSTDGLANPNPVLEEIAAYVVDALGDGPTLVHCQAGLNRSGLIAALALIHLGETPADAIALLRSQRTPIVLCNPVFEAWLLGRVAP